MNPALPNASTSGGKSINISPYLPLQPQQNQVISPAFDSNSRRFLNNSGSSQSTARNNQSNRKQHKNSRRPRLVDEDSMAESGVMRNTSSRRGQTSITHLMNFTLLPRPQDYQNTIFRSTRRGNNYGIGSGHHSSDKARYIHANYRFIVKPSGNYKQQAINANEYLDWNDVLQILASSVSQDASCPICLSHPMAPRMAKCGHIFCLPCLIRYMHTTDDSSIGPEKKPRSKKCPICWDCIYISETRPVRWHSGQESLQPQEGDDIVLRLVMRQPDSTLALPRDGAEILGKSEDIPWYFAAEVTDYARIMKGSEEYMIEQYRLEIEDIRRQEIEDELIFEEDPEWTRKAANAVMEAMENMKGIGNPPRIAKQPMEKPSRRSVQFRATDKDIAEISPFDQLPGSNPSLQNRLVITESPNFQSKDSDTTSFQLPRSVLHEGHQPDAPYYFYQALLHYYLAPLDIRILKSAFGNFASFPSTILPRVERVSTGHTMDDEMRKRMKYLSHLPHGCEVTFLECNWTDVVVPEILDQFKEEIEKRRKRNREKGAREERDRLRAEKAEDDARWANTRRKRPNILSEACYGEEFHDLAASPLDAMNVSPPQPTRQGSSFASLASPATSPGGARTVWGTSLVAPASPETLAEPTIHHGDDGWLQSWEAELEAENNLIAESQKLSLEGQGSEDLRLARGRGQVKKKKAKKITLMSTTARRAA